MAHVRYINCLFWELRDNGVVNNLQFSPESLHVMLLRICINVLNVGYSGWQGRQTGIGLRGVGWGGGGNEGWVFSQFCQACND